MIYAYYPGCTLHTQARGFKDSTARAAAALGMELREIPSWQCCGGVFPLVTDNLFPVVSAARNLAAASRLGAPMVTVCSACYHVHKRTNLLMAQDAEKRDKLDRFIESDYAGQVQVLHLIEAIRREVGAEGLRPRVKRPLMGLKVAAYYGCLLLRPEKELGFDDPEAPHVLEDLLSELGAEPVQFSFRSECCGAYLSVSRPEASRHCSSNVLRSAARAGAEVVVTSCPLCFFNLDEQQPALMAEDYGFQPLPVVYFTQLLALALGAWPRPWYAEEHRVDPGPVLGRYAAEGADAAEGAGAADGAGA
jgi:heterodisulfide reductase subunit B